MLTRTIRLTCLVVLGLLGVPPRARAMNGNSTYIAQPAGVVTVATGTTKAIVLSATVNVPSPGRTVFLESDGTFWSEQGANVMAYIELASTGERLTNVSEMDTTINDGVNNHPKRHTFNTLGIVQLPTGSVTFNLVLEHLSAQPPVHAQGSNMIVAIDPAPGVASNITSQERPPTANGIAADCHLYSTPNPLYTWNGNQWFNFTTKGIGQGSPIPRCTLLTNAVTPTVGGKPVISLASSSMYKAAGMPVYHDGGDQMMGVFMDGGVENMKQGGWGDGDQWEERVTPMVAHRIFPDVSAAAHNVTMDVSEWPWVFDYGPDEDAASIRVKSGARLVSFWAAPIMGQAVLPWVASEPPESIERFGGRCVAQTDDPGYDFGKNQACPVEYKPDCPRAVPGQQTRQELAIGTFHVPFGHNGKVMFFGKSKILGSQCDYGGTAEIWLELDGVKVGSLGQQGVAYPDVEIGSGISTRTASVSYMATGLASCPTSADCHTIKLIGGATPFQPCAGGGHEGTFQHLWMSTDGPVVFLG